MRNGDSKMERKMFRRKKDVKKKKKKKRRRRQREEEAGMEAERKPWEKDRLRCLTSLARDLF